ncbi:MAG: tetratricopeptide repeat protein [Candidatus Auribacterota bacterium]
MKKTVYTVWRPYVLLVVLCFIAYANTLYNGFVYDDPSVISENPRVAHWQNFRFLFDQKYFKITGKGKETAFGEASYRPVATATYFIDAMLFNRKAWGSHLTNLIFHMVNACLLFLLTRMITGSQITALMTGILFSAHPVLTEAVNAIAFREDLLVVFFLLIALLCFVKRQSSNSSKRTFIIILMHSICLFLALFAKEMALAYPFLLGVLVLQQGISFRKNTDLLISGAMVYLFYVIVRFFMMTNPNETGLFFPGGTWLSNVYTMSTVFLEYFIQLFYPACLLADYQPTARRTLTDPMVIISLVTVSGLFISAFFYFIRKRSIISGGILFFFFALGPVSNITPIGNICAERYLYLPIIGLLWSICTFIFVTQKFVHSKRLYLICIVCIVTLALSRTITRNTDWKDSESLWNATIETEPKSYRAYSNLASLYFDRGEYRKSIKYYIGCLMLRRTPQNHYNLGNAYRRIDDFQRAVEEYQQAIAIDPTFPEIYNNLGLTLIEMKRYTEAEEALNKALYYGQPDEYVLENLGLLYDHKGEYETAIDYYKKAIQYNPKKASPYNKLAVLYVKNGEAEKGLGLFKEALQRFPSNVQLYKNTAVLYNQLGDKMNEIFYWEQAHKIAPDDKEIIQILIDYYRQTGNTEKTQKYLYKLYILTKESR